MKIFILLQQQQGYDHDAECSLHEPQIIGTFSSLENVNKFLEGDEKEFKDEYGDWWDILVIIDELDALVKEE